MKDFFSIETPYNSEEYKIMKTVVNKDVDTLHEGFEKSKFTKSHNNGKFLWNIHLTELESLYKRLEELYHSTKNDDYESFLDEIKKNAPAYKEIVEESLELSEKELRQLIKEEMETIQKENTSDSLLNQHGENLKPETMDEAWGDRYENVAFAQGDDAVEPLEILNNNGPEAALEYMKQWHYPGEHDGNKELGHGTEDETFEKDGYILSWNSRLGYIGLEYDTEYGKSLSEDSLMKRKQAGQREKDVPLGQHAPHSQKAKK